ncbi:endonuclease/exonuclease/phosphatase family protein [Aureibaculum sp. 2210JD6-5]|uniref:endonuclease/exonuclease/phosphatase family protein n=1 Tax=Aureibaculum sp. 2210JD6-5 TaxID=3103957 RepID=UPI002AAE7BDC|nr:endonuclease/exonuclease/phosphatase family protein [Aureibaculum sp. 2210JD6-5]MDY7394710.1 endonuclease/exonuclease/phosphatase family protein [Aureibaculum sp. 2210JD6-5]
MKNLLFLITMVLFFISVHGQNLSVMTYNIRLDVASDEENAWEHRKEFITEQIKFYGPDVMGTQEGRPNQIKFMKETLTDYKMIGHGREGGDNGEYSAIFYNTNKVKVENDSTFWLSETPEIRSKGWDAAFERNCTYGLFTDLESLEKVWIFNTHLDHVGQQSRLNSMKLIQERIKTINTENHPIIIMGDLNVEPDNELISNLQQNFVDTKESSKLKFGPSGTFNGFKFNEPVTRRIDYIFVSKSPPVMVKKYAVLSDSKDLKYPSDHLPVYVKLELE